MAIIGNCEDENIVESDTNALSRVNNPSQDVSLTSDRLTIKIQPNPFRDQATINYVLPSSGNTTLSISNLQGQQMKVLLNSVYQDAGKYQYEFFKEDFPKGLYLISLQTKEGTETRKVIILE